MAEKKAVSASKKSKTVRGKRGASVSKHTAFVDLAESRTNAVIDKLRILGNISDTRRYEFTEAEVEEMFRAILNAVEKTRNLFRVTNPLSDTEFKFSKGQGGE